MPDNRITQSAVLALTLESGYIPNRLAQAAVLVVTYAAQGAMITQAPVMVVTQFPPLPPPLPLIPDVPVTEIWQWNTVVTIAENGKERRSTLRSEPRVSSRFMVTLLNDEDRVRAYQYLSNLSDKVFSCPLYVYSTKLSAGAPQGSTKLYLNPTFTDLRSGEAITLFNPTTQDVLFATVQSVDVDGVRLTEGISTELTCDWLVCPAPEFRFRSVLGLRMYSVSGEIELDLEGASVRDALRPNQSEDLLTFIDGILLIDKPQLSEEGVPEDFDQNVSWSDNKIARPVAQTNWKIPFVSGERSFLAHRPKDLDYWRAVADHLKGMFNKFLLPTFRNDLPVVEQPDLGSTVFVTDNFQYYNLRLSPTYKYVRIKSKSGVIYRKVLKVEVNYDLEGKPTGATITLNGSIGSSPGSNEDMVVSYVNLCRLDSDEVALEHNYADTIIRVQIRTIES